MRHLCLLLIVLLPLTGHADKFFEVEDGDEPNHLTPLNPPDAYDERLAKHLFLTDGQFGRFLARPSFGAESCVSVHAEIPEEAKKKYHDEFAVPDDEQKYFITVTRASESLWYSMPRNNEEKKAKEVKITRVDREISLELAIAIQRAWGRMLQHTRYPAKASLGFDGITYHFSVWVRGLGDLYGRTWTPQGGLTAEIAALGIELATFGTDKNAAEKPLIKKLKAFESKIPKP
ncbi:hypothetical protein [Verrucomicrobium sp. BvORR034]|uniref:hypothetical protein n=1 Tax=Verrucomicrobium sp. BvORR034 TaxID=1396418 RepID=UPI000678944C|nr:hypothetical protein [Verrucomicrobium sp. BvORR034]